MSDQATRNAAWEIINAIKDHVGVEPRLTPAEWGQRFSTRFRAYVDEHRSDDADADADAEIDACVDIFSEVFGQHLFSAEHSKMRRQSHRTIEAADREYGRASHAADAATQTGDLPHASAGGPERTPPVTAAKANGGTKERPSNGHASNGQDTAKKAKLDKLIQAQLGLRVTVRGTKSDAIGNLLKHEIQEAKASYEKEIRTKLKTWRLLDHYEPLYGGWTSKSLNQLIIDGKIEPELLPLPATPLRFPFAEVGA